MRVIPDYQLYGDHELEAWSRAYFLEAIPWRANRYNNDIRPHFHSAFIQLLYMKSGSVEVLLDQEKITARAPCLIIVPAEVVHAFNFSNDVDGPVVTARQSLLETLAALLMPALVTFMRTPAVIAIDEGTQHITALNDLFALLEKESDHPGREQVAIGMPLVFTLLASFARMHRGAARAASAAGTIGAVGPSDVSKIPAKASVRSASTIARFRTLLDLRFKEHLPIEQYAAELGVSAGHLSRICRETLGMSAQDVVSRRIIHAAQRELVYTNLPIKQLAATLGFSDENYFARFFRKHTGASPKDFRAQASIGKP
jgi:AraC family transcriptional activator of pobA